MSKELTPLEALKRLYDFNDLPSRNMIAYLLEQENLPTYYKVIETALKKLEQTQIILGAEKIEDLPNLATTIDNELYSTSYKLKQNEKKLKALKIIKEKQVDVSCLLFDGLEIYNENMHPSRILTQEEYDLLKEVLL